MITKEKLEALKKCAKAVRLKEWEYSTGLNGDEHCVMGIKGNCTFQIAKSSFAGRKEDIQYMVEADPETILSLIAYVEDLESSDNTLPKEEA